jgi:hypothetical protein
MIKTRILPVFLALALTPGLAEVSTRLGGGNESPERLLVASTTSVGTQTSSGPEMVEPSRFRIRNANIDGQGNVVKVRRGGTHRVRFDLLHDCSTCGGAINQVIVGLESQDRAQASVWEGGQFSGNAGGPARWVSVSANLTIPDEPGFYAIRARYAQAFAGDPNVLNWWKVDRPNGPGPKSTIGVVVVTG